MFMLTDVLKTALSYITVITCKTTRVENVKEEKSTIASSVFRNRNHMLEKEQVIIMLAIRL